MTDSTASTIHAALQEAAQKFPNRTALTFLRDGTPEEQPRTVTYGGLLSGVTRAANVFAELGGPGVGVAFMLPSLVETHFVLWGAETSGYAVPLNPFLTVEQVEELIRSSGARILVTVGQAAPEVWAKGVEMTKRITGLRLVCVGEFGLGAHDALSLGAEMEKHDADRLTFSPSADPQRPVAYFHTGGTTGTPKLVTHTHANQLAAARGAGHLLDIRETDVVTNGMPLFHVGGTMATSLAFFLRGANVLMMSGLGFRNPAMVTNIWRIVERYGVTAFGAVPTALASILAVPLNGRLDSVRYGLTGASLCPASVSRKFGEVTGKPLHELLGMTETGGVTAADPVNGTPTQGAVGFAIPDSVVRVRKRLADGSLGEDCPRGEIGVLFVAGVNVSPGYKDAAQNAGVFMDGGLNSGDLAFMDEQGKLRIAGRAKDLIIRSGHNIDPAMIEHAFTSHPAVEAAAAVGQPDRYAGEMPVVFVVLRDPGFDLAQLETYVREHIAERPAWPRAIYAVQTLPVTAVGKPFKPALRADAAVRLLEPALRALSGDARLTVEAAEGGKRGMDITVRLTRDDARARERIRQELDGYAFAWSFAG